MAVEPLDGDLVSQSAASLDESQSRSTRRPVHSSGTVARAWNQYVAQSGPKRSPSSARRSTSPRASSNEIRSTGPLTSSSSSGRVSGQMSARSRSEVCARRARVYSRWRIKLVRYAAGRSRLSPVSGEVEPGGVDREPDGVADAGLRAGVDARRWAEANSRVLLQQRKGEYGPLELLREPFPGIDWSRALVDLAEAVAKGRPHRASAEHAAHVVEILNAVERSAAEGGHTEVRSTFERPEPMEWAR
jgi:hypothetical protein